MVTNNYVIIAWCSECGWIGLLDECNPLPCDHDRQMCPKCGEDVDSRQVDRTPENKESTPLCECGRPLVNKDVCSDRNCQHTSW